MPIKIRTQNKTLQTLKYICKKKKRPERGTFILHHERLYFNQETAKRLRNLKFTHCLHIVQSLFPRPKEALKGQHFSSQWLKLLDIIVSKVNKKLSS